MPDITVLVLDGQGGGIGRALVSELRRALPALRIVAVGTNVQATAAMLRAGADAGATGENAAMYNAARASYILGPLGIVMANAMFGEISPRIAAAVSESAAHKVLIPVSKCHASIVGVTERPLAQYIEEAAAIVKRELEG